MSWPHFRLLVTAIALLLAMLLSAWIGRRQRAGAVVLALLSFVWLTVDRMWEGSLLLTVTKRHGLVASDFVGLAGFVVAGLQLRRLGRPADREPNDLGDAGSAGPFRHGD